MQIGSGNLNAQYLQDRETLVISSTIIIDMHPYHNGISADFSDTNFMEVPKIHEIYEIYSS